MIPRSAHCATNPTIMQALSAAHRCSCGLANRFDPPSSRGSSISIENRRGIRLPPMSKPSICVRLHAWPCQVVVARQLVLPFAASRLTLSIRANRSSTLMPLTTAGSAIFGWASMMGSHLLGLGGIPVGSNERSERRLNAPALLSGDHAGQHLPELWVLSARVNVLPAVGLEECSRDGPRLGLVHRAAALRCEVSSVSFGLGLQDAVH